MEIQDSFFKIKPWEHQRKAVKHSIDLDGYGFFFEVGAGKTMACVNTLRIKYAQSGRLLRTLIVAPPIVLENWKKEFLMHSKIDSRDIVILHGPGKKRIERLRKLTDDAKAMGRSKIIVTNYESLTMGSKRDKKKRLVPGELFGAIMAYQPEVCVWDESHRCKDIRAGRTIAAVKLADQAAHNYLLTGTPILNSLEDIFAQFRILDKGRTFGTQYFAFRHKYFVDRNVGMPKQKYYPDWQPKQGAADVINGLVSRKSMHVTKAECLDLPPLVKKTIEVKMSQKQQKAYDDMKRQLITYIKENEDSEAKAAVAEYAMTKALRLQQIVSGFVNIEAGGGTREAHRFSPNTRKDALKELLTDIAPKHKVLVWAVFKENYNDIREVCEKLKLQYVEVHGDVSQKDKMLAVESLNNDDSTRVLIGHPGSGGIGINLVAASHTIFYSRSFSLEYEIQAEARNYRGGSEMHDKVTRIDLVTPDTIDEQVLKALASKKNIGYQVLKEML